MDKKTQDRLWASLDKQARWSMRTYYYANFGSSQVDDVAKNTASVLEYVFGEHNLNSDTEPEEILTIKRRDVIKMYQDHNLVDSFGIDSCANMTTREVLKSLFGDKCLSDKELEHRLEQTSVQVEPKFSIGDGVIFRGGCYKITGIEHSQKGIRYAINFPNNEHKCIFKESELEPYTEPSNVSADETMNETKDNMEEKELNLCELLKDCKGEEFYSLMHGKVRFMTISADGFVMFDYPENISVYDNGKYDLNAEVIIYPSRALYEKYSLDAYAAWMEWKEARKPKYEFTGCLYIYKEDGATADEIDLPDINFNSLEEARQAAEAVRETLEKFRKEHTPKPDK